MANTYVNKVQLADGTSLIDISDTTATADKILSGYTAYGADGSKLTGTATGGGSVTQDQDGFIVLPPDGGGSPSVGGLEYEEGTWTPSEDVNNAWHSFNNAHSTIPMYVVMEDTDMNTIPDSSWAVCSLNLYSSFGGAAGSGLGVQSRRHKDVGANMWSNGNSNLANESALNNTISTTQFRTEGANTSAYWRANRTYKWIAVWAPTT